MTDTITAPTVAAEITSAAIDSFDACPDPRLREIMRSLVRHLHAFASEVKLTEADWTAAVDILTATGHITTDKRSEFILWSDTLGLSMLVDAMAHPRIERQRRDRVDGAGPVLDSGRADPRVR